MGQRRVLKESSTDHAYCPEFGPGRLGTLLLAVHADACCCLQDDDLALARLLQEQERAYHLMAQRQVVQHTHALRLVSPLCPETCALATHSQPQPTGVALYGIWPPSIYLCSKS